MSYENSKKYDAENPKPSTNLLEQSRNLWLQAVRGEVGERAAKKWYSDLIKGLYLGEVPEMLQKFADLPPKAQEQQQLTSLLKGALSSSGEAEGESQALRGLTAAFVAGKNSAAGNMPSAALQLAALLQQPLASQAAAVAGTGSGATGVGAGGATPRAAAAVIAQL